MNWDDNSDYYDAAIDLLCDLSDDELETLLAMRHAVLAGVIIETRTADGRRAYTHTGKVGAVH